MTRLRRDAFSILLLGLVATSCSTSRIYFRPAEEVLTETVDGVAGAQYELRDEDGRKGEVRVWCLGVVLDEEEPDGNRRGSRSFVDLGMAIENTSEEELVLVCGDTRLRDIQCRDRVIDSLEPVDAGAPIRVAPDSVSRVYLSFELPRGIEPRDVKSFLLRWVVTGSTNRRYAEFTTFLPGRRRYRRSAPYGFWGFTLGVPYGYWGYHRH